MIDLDCFSMFSLGVLGTGHCLGMCGPLVFVFPGQSGRFSDHIAYHMGRLLTYTCMGAILGGLITGISGIVDRAGGDALSSIGFVQVFFSLFAAVFMALFGLQRLGLLTEPGWMSFASPGRIPGWKATQAMVKKNPTFGPMFATGLCLGMIPCGLSYAALARAMASGGLLEGASMMAAFGLGTLPGLLLVGTAASALLKRYRHMSEILSGMIMIAMAGSLAFEALQALAS